ncbi:DMT family transporter [Labrenzia sp. VG12]|uniref:DMT family transporter n=1 Tax=Labrenzia sp. VG12 TaxID=2021862 RepID=UPI000B8C09C8|nr:DMT family transporter [Labrenzia sp. VG12]ASP33878.1 EamA family transporter [Labrenzia sp. VG12]
MSSEFKGIVLRIGATAFFTLMVVFIKFLADTVPVGQVVFYRSAFALIPLVLYLMLTREFPSGLRTKRPGSHVLRCLLGCMAMFASFASLKFLPLSHASIIGYLAPVLAVALAAVLLREVVSNARWFGVIFGLIGVLILVLPSATAAEVDRAYLIGVGLAFAMAVLTAGAKIQIRSLALTENAGAIAFYFALTCTVAGLATIGFGWVTPTWEQLGLLICTGLAGGVAHILMTVSYQHSDVSKLAAFEYLSLIFAVLADALFFDILPEPVFYLSAALIIGATLIVALKDTRRKEQTA